MNADRAAERVRTSEDFNPHIHASRLHPAPAERTASDLGAPVLRSGSLKVTCFIVFRNKKWQSIIPLKYVQIPAQLVLNTTAHVLLQHSDSHEKNASAGKSCIDYRTCIGEQAKVVLGDTDLAVERLCVRASVRACVIYCTRVGVRECVCARVSTLMPASHRCPDARMPGCPVPVPCSGFRTQGGSMKSSRPSLPPSHAADHAALMCVCVCVFVCVCVCV